MLTLSTDISTEMIPIEVIDDLEIDKEIEEFTMTLVIKFNETRVTLHPDTTTLKILDDEPIPPITSGGYRYDNVTIVIEGKRPSQIYTLL